MNPLLYVIGLLPGILTLVGVLGGGALAWVTPVFVFVLVPVIELLWSRPPPDKSERAWHGPVSDVLLLSTVPLNLAVLGALVWQASAGALTGYAWVGAVMSVGIVLGMYGLNVGHELGHRRSRGLRALAWVLMGTVLYAHWQIEHTRGHHVRVATPEDPATSRLGEWVFPFWVRSVVGGARSALALAPRRVVVAWVLQAVAVLVVAVALGVFAAVTWLAAAVVGVLLLETVNYVEHYGLRRRRLPDGRYERVSPAHSWNSESPLGRMLLFDLPRHADHHAYPQRRCAELRVHAGAPELPAGYPAMILLALVPPLFHRVMHDASTRRPDPEAVPGA